VDDVEVAVSSFMGWPGATGEFADLPTNTGFLPIATTPGTHVLALRAESQQSGCSSGVTNQWEGTLRIRPAPAPDTDGDGEADSCDLCPADPANDVDADGTCGEVDNCPEVANAVQTDADGDGHGDACDSDADGDGVADAEEPCFCAATASDDHATTKGCGIAQLCPCAAPLGRDAWQGHREYVACVKSLAREIERSGRLSRLQRVMISSAASRSLCGQ
jgi:hypothetical protein